MCTAADIAAPPSVRAFVRLWWKVGWISFGGTAAHLAIMHRELVERRGWIGSEEFFHVLNYCMLLPGPEAQQLAIYIGWRLHGKLGGVLAGVLFVLPSVAILLALSLIYGRFGASPFVGWVFALLKPVVLVLILRALLQVGRRALRTKAQYIVAVCALLLLMMLHVSLPWILLAAVFWGTANAVFKGSRDETRAHRTHMAKGFVWSSYWRSVLWTVGTCSMLATAPLLALFWTGFQMKFWLHLSGFFTQTAFITLGGSYTVVPYVAQIAVTKYGWLTRAQMLDGFALAETTPGPLIIVVAFIGFMAGLHASHGSLLIGTLALLLTCLYTFLPSFLFVFVGAPWALRSQGSSEMKAVLEMVGPVIIAAILQLAIFLVKGVLFRHDVMALRAVNWWAAVEILLVLLVQWLFDRYIAKSGAARRDDLNNMRV
jgi:chromate transporter